MQIIISETNELSELDIRVLRALVGDESATAAPVSAKTAPETAPKAAPAPAKKAAAAAKPKAEPTPEPEPEEVDEPEDTTPEIDPVEAALEVASKYVEQGKTAQVKAALAVTSAKRVSELKPADVPAFLEALEG